MSLNPRPIFEVPEETARVAHAAFPKGNIYLRIRDRLGVFFADEQFASLFSERGQPAFSRWRLALISIMQFVEDLSDRQAAEAVRGRIDWKYLLGLELEDADMTKPIHEALAEKELLPGTHLADAGYVDAEQIVNSQTDHDLHLGPVRPDTSWQTIENTGYAITDFVIDWESKLAVYPNGATSSAWTPKKDAWNNAVIGVKFSNRDCGPCPTRSCCTRQATHRDH
jgi:transposase